MLNLVNKLDKTKSEPNQVSIEFFIHFTKK